MKNTLSITLATIVQQQSAEQILVTEIGDELVMMNLEVGSYIRLNKMGRIIWKMMAEAIAVKDLVKLLTSQFNVSDNQCRTDCMEYLNEMLEQKIISVKV